LIEHVAETRLRVKWCRVALAHTLGSTEAVFNPPWPPTCS
jgi:hypothetical protein